MERERREQRARISGGGDAGADFFDLLDSGTGAATVSHGPYIEQLPVAGLEVSQVRERFADRLDIDPDSVALIDGDPVDDATRVRAGQVLAFIRQSGVKGGRR